MVRILLVGESPAERALVRKTLLVAGHQVVEATGGMQALDLVQRAPFDAVVLDLSLPDATGAEVIDGIRERRGLLPIVALAEPDASDPALLTSLVGAGVTPLGKPFAAHDLLGALERGLDEAARAIALERPAAVIKLPEEEPTETV